ncbi:putative invasin [Edwardsiella piscicida]|uniref:Invasin n=4 Tax=Edwardsiella TaxID=635 RepID=A0AAU8P0X4_EDWPI|nr:invasin domain 3-containing protein [Edwardsiella piscicida]ACY83170.1 putative invasin [Edwardsiella tarda EIB202]
MFKYTYDILNLISKKRLSSILPLINGRPRKSNSTSSNKPIARKMATPPQPIKIKVMAWCNIITQILFPIAISFSPSMSLAAAQRSSMQIHAQSTEPYILKKGETVGSVAKKLGVTVSQLKKINQFRKFAHGIDKIGAGDEIDIPHSGSSLTKPGSPAAATPLSPHADTSERESRVAGQLMGVGRVLASPQSSNAASEMARSWATAAANDEIVKWLSKYGTAQLQLNIDKNFSLDGSALDWLLPFYDTPTTTTFTQLGFRNRDHRNTLNIGIGTRTLSNNWLFGVNAFYDHDLSGKNSRLGLGSEAWTDYLQLSLNGYLRLSDWHQSRDLADYNERPANGFDVRANAWMPTLPQLGGKLMYEQYFGDAVGLFGKDNLQRNPYAFTVGVNYTPFPLLTLGVDQRLGKNSEHDTQFNVQLNYRIGDDWRAQVDPSAVPHSRLISESRYNLVERNNNIVLEYQKQNIMHLSLPSDTLSGQPGSEHMISAILQTKYGLQDIVWQDAEFISAGGKLQRQDKTHFNLTLPSYRYSATARRSGSHATAQAEIAANTYHLSATAFDTKGNQSNTINLTVTVEPPTVFQGKFEVQHDNAVANGSDAISVDYILTDESGGRVANKTILMTTNNGAKPSNAEINTDQHGVARLNVTNTAAGATLITATVNGVSQTQSVNFIADSAHPDANKSILLASPKSIVANGKDATALTLQLKDAYGNPISGQSVTFISSESSGITVSSTTDSGNGNYSATLSGTRAGPLQITVAIDGKPLLGRSAPVTLTADSSQPDAAKSTLTATPDHIVANGTDAATLTLTLKDINDNPIDGQKVAFISSERDGVAISHTTDHGNGSYSATLNGTRAGTTQVTVTVDGKPLAVSAAAVTLSADGSRPDATRSLLEAKPSQIVANGTEAAALMLTLKDVNGNLISGQRIAFISSENTGITVSSATDEGNGRYTATLRGTRAGITQVSVTIDGTPLAVHAARVTLTADSSNPNADKSILEANPSRIVANGVDAATLTLTLKDINDNLISGQSVAFISSEKNGVHISNTTDEGNGRYRATLSGTRAGITQVTVAVDGNPLAVSAATVTLTADSSKPDAALSTLEAKPNQIVANGTEAAALALMLKDVNGNPISGQRIAFISSENTGIVISGATDEGNGRYSATLKGTRAGATQITVTVDGKPLAVSAATVTLTADSSKPDATLSTLAVTPNQIVANGADSAALALILKDINGNPISGQSVAFISSEKNGVRISQTTDEDNGRYSATLSGTRAGMTQVTVTVDGKPLAVSAVTVTLHADSSKPDASLSSFAVNPHEIVANGSDAATLTLLLKDINDNPLAAQNLAFISSETNGVSITTTADEGNGRYSATLTGTRAVSTQITVKVNGVTLGVAAETVRLKADSSNPDAGQSALVVDPSRIVANGKDNATLTLTLKDVNGNLLAGQTVAFSGDLGIVVGRTVDHGDGTYSAVLTAGITAGSARILTTVNGNELRLNAPSLTLTADSSQPDATKSTLAAKPDQIVANGTEAAALTLTLKDINGNPISGQNVKFVSSEKSGISVGNTSDEGNGRYRAALSGTRAGMTQVTVTIDGNPLAVNAVTVTLTADSSKPDAALSTLTAKPEQIVANGIEASTLTLALKDIHDNPISGQRVAFISSENTGITVSSTTDDGSGNYSATLSGTHAVSTQITVTVNGVALAIDAKTVNLTADSSNPDAAKSSLKATPKTIVANGSDASTLTLTLKDVNGNLISGQTVAFISSEHDGITVSGTTDNGNGDYSATLQGTRAIGTQITVTVNGQPLAVSAATVTLTADSSHPDSARSTLVAAPTQIVTDSTQASTLTLMLMLKDINDNPISGQDVAFISSEKDGIHLTATAEKGNGSYSATLTGTRAGTTEITVTVGGKALAVHAATVTLIADSSKPDATLSTLEANPYNLEATTGASGRATLTLTLKDVHGNPIAGQEVVLSTDLGSISDGGRTTGHADGTYTATIYAGTAAGIAHVTTQLNGSAFPLNLEVPINGDSSAPDPSKSSFEATPNLIVANGVETSALKLTLRDAHLNPISSQDVKFISSKTNGITISSTTPLNDGTYHATLAGTEAFTTTITVTVNGNPMNASLHTTVTLNGNKDHLDSAQSTLALDNATAEANSPIALTLTLKDTHGNPVSGQRVKFISSAPEYSTFGAVRDDGNGVYTATVSNIIPGSIDISVEVNGTALATLTEKATFTAMNVVISDTKTQNNQLSVNPGTEGSRPTATNLYLLRNSDNKVLAARYGVNSSEWGAFDIGNGLSDSDEYSVLASNGAGAYRWAIYKYQLKRNYAEALVGWNTLLDNTARHYDVGTRLWNNTTSVDYPVPTMASLDCSIVKTCL